MLVQQCLPRFLILLGAGVRTALNDLVRVFKAKMVVNVVREPCNVRDIRRESVLELLSDFPLKFGKVIPDRQDGDPVL